MKRQQDLAGGLARYWPALLMIAYASYYDYLLNGDPAFAVTAAGAAALPLLLPKLVAPITRVVTRSLGDLIPARYRRLALVGAPLALLFLTRWKGQMDDSTALLSLAAPLAIGALIVANRSRLDAALSPFYRVRNELLPRSARVIVAVGTPLALTFLIVHGDLGDLPAFFGGTTSSPTLPTERGAGAFLLTTTVSTLTGFLMLNEPGRRRGRG